MGAGRGGNGGKGRERAAHSRARARSSLSADAAPVAAVSAFCAAAALLAAAHRLLLRRGAAALVGAVLVWGGALPASLLVALAALRLPSAYRSFLSIWRLQGRAVPVWVGEIGTRPDKPDPLWGLLWG